MGFIGLLLFIICIAMLIGTLGNFFEDKAYKNSVVYEEQEHQSVNDIEQSKKQTKFCFNCGKEIDKNAVICVHCGVEVEKREEEENNNGCIGCLVWLGIFFLIDLIVGIIWFFVWMGPAGDAFVKSSMESTSSMLARDAAEQFEIARKSKDFTTMCIQAGVAAQFYLESKDESSYKEWHKVEKHACKAAGMMY